MPAEKKVVILEHVPSEKAGTILDYLKEEKIPHQEVQLFAEKFKLPDLSRVRALVVMGGPMNVYEEEKHPFLIKENIYIQNAVEKGIPFLGVCLGSQLLAKALGSRVYKAQKPEVGWGDIQLSPAANEDRVLGAPGLKKMRVLQWHEDTFDLPPGAVHLASSQLVHNQAYVCEERFYGFQFHVEVNRAMLKDWFGKHADKEKILSEYDSYERDLHRITQAIYSGFFALSA